MTNPTPNPSSPKSQSQRPSQGSQQPPVSGSQNNGTANQPYAAESNQYSGESGEFPSAYSASPQATPPQGTESSALIQIMRELSDVKHMASAQMSRSAEDVKRLKGRMQWLTGISAVAIVLLGGALIGVTLGLRQEQTAIRENQQQLTEQVETLQAQEGNAEQLGRIEELLTSLNENAQNLGGQAQSIVENLPEASGEQLQAIQEDLKDLQQGISENLSPQGALERLNNLYERVRGLTGDENNAEPENGSGEGDAAN
ncbi:MAG: hypothetical protein WBA57_13550 [Elainellaceae cyanobacterium]